ncbi:MAG: hypothetical protein RLY14_3238 [Planctomycetota bacterium]|jgi:hypothetical protein
MRFVEMTGSTLMQVVTEHDLPPQDLLQAGVAPNAIVRINEQGDIELRKRDRWDVVGGLLGNYQERVRNITGLDYA